jgi:hypothetical protein
MASYKFRVLLDNSNNEEIFRDITISGEDNFESFYNIILNSFYFSGEQLGSFYLSNNDWDKGDEIALMDMGMSTDANAPLVMSETKIHEQVTESDQKFILVYDFLKMWCFLIELIQIDEKTIELPEINLSIGIAPEEKSRDSGEDIDDTKLEDEYDLGSDFDDIFSEFDDEEDFGGFENIDDYDI